MKWKKIMTHRLFSTLALFVLMGPAMGCQQDEGVDFVARDGGITPLNFPGSGGSGQTSDAGGARDLAQGPDVDGVAGVDGGGGVAGLETGSGGATGTGGAPGTGGATDTGGAPGTGGMMGTGGMVGTGGTVPPAPPGLAEAIIVTDHWIPAGWYGDQASMDQFLDAARSPIVLTRMATDGPCANRMPGAVGECIKITFRPLNGMAPSQAVGIYLLAVTMNKKPDWTQGVVVPPGANQISALVAGAEGGEAVKFNFGHAPVDSFASAVSPSLTRSWQPISRSLVGATYDRIVSPFGWSSKSATNLTFYFDDVRIQ